MSLLLSPEGLLGPPRAAVDGVMSQRSLWVVGDPIDVLLISSHS